MDGPDGSACTWHLALCLYSSMDSTVSRTLPGLKRELEAFYSSSAMLMSWRAIRTVCQADLVRLHLHLIFNIWEEVQLALALALALPVAAHDVRPLSPVRF